MKQKLSIETLRENLEMYLSPQLQGFQGTKCYDALVDAVWNFLTASRFEREEKRQIFYHQKQVFEDFVEFEKRKDQAIEEKSWMLYQ